MTGFRLETDGGLLKTDHNSLHVNKKHKSGERLREKQCGNEVLNFNAVVCISKSVEVI